MTVLSGKLLVGLLVGLQVAALAFRLSKRKQLAGLVLLTGPVIVLATAMMTSGPGGAQGSDNLKWIAFELAIVGLALLSLWRAALWFWLAWIANFTQLTVFFYLAFFWRVFS